MRSNKNIGIIGAGLGGMSAAVMLASEGYQVDVYEASSSPGGKAGCLSLDGFTFDTGPSLLTMPFVLSGLFEEAGESLDDYLELIPLDIICRYFYNDGTVINAYSDADKFSSEISLKTEDSAGSVHRYLEYSKKIFELTADLFLFNSPSKISTYLNRKALKALLNIRSIDPFRTIHSANSHFFKDKRTIQLFDRYATYNGSDPFKAPATLNIIPHVEYGLGSFYAKGGMRAVTSALKKLADKKGVNFIFDTPVEEILISSSQAAGIRTASSEYHYNYIISNSDVNFTYSRLLDKNKGFTNNAAKAEPSLSAMVFYWGVEGNHDELTVHNILFSSDYRSEFEDLFSKKIKPDDPTVYSYISCKFNKDDAPNGYENWFVMVNAPCISGQNWEDEIIRTRKNVIKKIKGITGISLTERIKTESVLSPPLLERKTGSYRGSIYGISSNNRFGAFLRHPNESKSIRNLFFCGGSVHPGGGIPLVLLSGKIAANLIIKETASFDMSRTIND